MKTTIDLNADLGEGCAYDAELMPIISSCSIACGGHAGDEASMRTAIDLAKANRVAAGAHPSFPDRDNFGRTKSNLRGSALERELKHQLNRLKRIALDAGTELTHLKPHGALYNMATLDGSLAESIVVVMQQVLPKASLFGPPGSKLEEAANAKAIKFVAEGFADRAYEKNGTLVDRSKLGSVLSDQYLQSKQALELALNSQVKCDTGEIIPLAIDTICIHGDTPGALDAARSIRRELELNGIGVCRAT